MNDAELDAVIQAAEQLAMPLHVDPGCTGGWPPTIFDDAMRQLGSVQDMERVVLLANTADALAKMLKRIRELLPHEALRRGIEAAELRGESFVPIYLQAEDARELAALLNDIPPGERGDG